MQWRRTCFVLRYVLNRCRCAQRSDRHPPFERKNETGLFGRQKRVSWEKRPRTERPLPGVSSRLGEETRSCRKASTADPNGSDGAARSTDRTNTTLGTPHARVNRWMTLSKAELKHPRPQDARLLDPSAELSRFGPTDLPWRVLIKARTSLNTFARTRKRVQASFLFGSKSSLSKARVRIGERILTTRSIQRGRRKEEGRENGRLLVCRIRETSTRWHEHNNLNFSNTCNPT